MNRRLLLAGLAVAVLAASVTTIVLISVRSPSRAITMASAPDGPSEASSQHGSPSARLHPEPAGDSPGPFQTAGQERVAQARDAQTALPDHGRAPEEDDLESALNAETDDPRHQNELVYAAFARLAERDAAAAGTWLNRLPAGRERDEATRLLVDGALEKYPASAFHWAIAIGGMRERTLQTQRVLRHWLAVDGPAARAGVRQAMGEAATRGEGRAMEQLAEALRVAEQQQRELRY